MKSLNIKRFVATLIWAIALSTFAITPLMAQTQSKVPPPAQELIDNAIKTAKAENKNILVNFGASWCGWCKRLNAFLHSPEFSKLISDNYILVYLTVEESPNKKALENPGAEELKARMGGAKAGVPFYFFLDKEGKKIGDSLAMPNGENIGHPANPQEIKAFEGLLERTAPHMTSGQRAEVVAYLSRNIPK